MRKSVLVLFLLFFIPSAVLAALPFGPQFAGQQAVEGRNSLAVTFSRPLDAAQDIGKFLLLYQDQSPVEDGAWILSEDEKTAYFTGIEPETEYLIRIRKGLKSAGGAILDTDREYQVTTRPVHPMIGFDTRGFILPAGLTRGLPVNALNIDRADIDFFRVRPDHYPDFARAFGRVEKMGSYQNDTLHQYADLVYSGRWDLEIKKDLRTQVNIPITHIKALAEPGIYFAVLRGAGHYDYQYSATWFSISDVGLHIRSHKNQCRIHAQSLQTAALLKDVQIRAFDRKGQVLSTVKTDEKGIAVLRGKVDRIRYISARLAKSISFVAMDIPAIDLSEFKTATAPFRPVDFFVYGPRDLYRPGETVVLDGLLRNHDGQMTAAVPVKARVIRPDGRTVHEFRWRGSNLNHFHHEYTLPPDAATGRWQIRFKHPATGLREYPFIVAEFLPERMTLSLNNPDGQTDIIKPSDPLAVAVQGDYLYGAPAAGNGLDADVTIRPARQLFKDRWPNFEFGDIAQIDGLSFSTDRMTLDPAGAGTLKIENQWKAATTPLTVTAAASLYDSGGRPVVRSRTWQVWPADTLVGIRLAAEDGQVDADTTAQLEVMAVDRSGNRIAASGLKVTVIREHREYYWEYRNDQWQWHFSSQTYPVDRFSLDIPDQGTADIRVPVEWGGYRVEITHPETGLVSSRRIWAGWHPDTASAQGGAIRPDRVDLVLDKPGYRAGDTAHVTIKAPEGGSGYLFVESDTNLLTLPVTVPAKGKTVSFTIDPSWDRHDLYLSALIVRKGTAAGSQVAGQLPKRAVGLIHLPLDRRDRKLSLDIQAPVKTEPNQGVRVTVSARQADGSVPENAWITLAAVDLGVLNLTGFKTPSPHDYFFQKRRFTPRLHDVYQRLIQAGSGAWAGQRFGGDAPALSRGGDRPSSDVRILAISRKAVPTDSQGMAAFSLDLPDFNGRARLMAVAHTGSRFGSGEKEMTIAAPLVTQIAMPRFLSMGDQGRIAIDLHNMTTRKQHLSVRVTTQGPVTLTGKGSRELVLEKDKKTTLVLPVFAQNRLGITRISLQVEGLVVNTETRTLKREWFLDVRPAYPALTTPFKARIRPGEHFRIPPGAMAGLISPTIDINAMVSPSPPINVAEHIRQLNAYPYGCLEQTTSGMFPHVILSASDFAALDIQRQDAAQTDQKISTGIQRLMEKRKSNGGFGLWSSRSAESCWLTCYAADFLVWADQAGYEIPASMMEKTMERLKDYVRRPGVIHSRGDGPTRNYRAAVRAYAAFVLARSLRISLGDARSVYRSIDKDLPGPLSRTQAGLALLLAGDRNRGEKALAKAAAQPRKAQVYYGDYGSRIRDAAMAYFLVSTFSPGFDQAEGFRQVLESELENRQWLSTQERNALVMAGSIHLKDRRTPWQATVSKGDRVEEMNNRGMARIFSPDGESVKGFEIRNTGQDDLYVSALLTGYADQKPEPVSQGLSVSRRYLDLSGKQIKLESLPDLPSGDRMLVELCVRADKRTPNVLVADLLPAGMELTDPNIDESAGMDDIRVDKKTIYQWHDQCDIRHTEYRDDRFAAAVRLEAGQRCRIFYPVRLVSPGTFLVPPPFAEDMYRPYVRAIGSSPALIKIREP